MERGRVKQFDTPSLLLQDKLGLFYQMVTHADKYYDYAAENGTRDTRLSWQEGVGIVHLPELKPEVASSDF